MLGHGLHCSAVWKSVLSRCCCGVRLSLSIIKRNNGPAGLPGIDRAMRSYSHRQATSSRIPDTRVARPYRPHPTRRVRIITNPLSSSTTFPDALPSLTAR